MSLWQWSKCGCFLFALSGGNRCASVTLVGLFESVWLGLGESSSILEAFRSYSRRAVRVAGATEYIALATKYMITCTKCTAKILPNLFYFLK